MTRLRILGTAAGVGVPAFYCDCPACQEARANPALARLRPGAALLAPDKTVLLDAGPDLRLQLLAAGARSVDAVFIGHWHWDHYAGLAELEFYMRLQRGAKIEVFLPPSALAEPAAAFPFLMPCLDCQAWEFGRAYDIGGVRLTPLPARHGIETAGFLLEGKLRVAYFTDTHFLPDETLARVRGVDLLLCDATMHGENWFPHSHMNEKEAVELHRLCEAKQTLLTHLALHYSEPITTRDLAAKLAAGGEAVGLAADGAEWEL
jgi:phosphoribosyl 1,2-cyclic phosphate phosphodiesterase